LLDRGIEVDLFDSRPDVGGNWYDGVYDSTHLITSRDSTGFLEYPMPGHLPDFPRQREVLDYLRAYAEAFGLTRRTRFEHEVLSVRPMGAPDGSDGWLVTARTPATDVRTWHYAGVVVANGHHWHRRVPPEAERFEGHQLHAKDYKSPTDLRGPRVLVVGAGNSACDMVVEAGAALGSADISMRHTAHFMPKTVFGKPITEMNNPWLPTWAQRLIMKPVLRVINGPYSRYGMPEPDHKLFSRPSPINSQMMYEMRHGTVRYRPGINDISGRIVTFTDGSAKEYDTILWATGYHVSFPFLEPGLFRWADGIPYRVCGQMPEHSAGIYLFGLIQLRGGAGPLLSRSAELLADLIEAQSVRPSPIAEGIAAVRPADNRFFTSVAGMIAEVDKERRIVARYRKGLPSSTTDLTRADGGLHEPEAAGTAGEGISAPDHGTTGAGSSL
jgi:hypothetical protein